MKEIEVNVYSITGNATCISVDSGEKVFNTISKILDNNHKAKISFQNIDLITSEFLNAAIGQLYGKYDEQKLKLSLSVENMLNEDKILLKKVIENAKLYFKKRESFSKVVDDEIEYY